MKILVLDDEAGTAQGFKLYAETIGHEVRVARTVEEAQAIPRSGFHPDAWLVDIHLRTAKGGSDFLKQMKPLPGCFVAWTAYRSEDLDVPDSVPVIYKPAEPELLLAALEKASRRRHEPLPSGPQSPP